MLGNDLLGDSVQANQGISAVTKARVFFFVDSFSWLFSIMGVIKLLKKDAKDDVVQLLKEACRGIVPVIEEAIIWGAFADTSATFLWGLGTQKYNAYLA